MYYYSCVLLEFELTLLCNVRLAEESNREVIFKFAESTNAPMIS